MVTTTLLLATTSKCAVDEESTANSLPASPSVSSVGSDLTASNSKSIRMPCRISVKRLKRHSLHEIPTAATTPNGSIDQEKLKNNNKRVAKDGQKKMPIFGAFKKSGIPKAATQREESGAGKGSGSPSAGIWRRARAIALRNPLKMSGSSSTTGSMDSGRKKRNEHKRREEEGGRRGETEERRRSDLDSTVQIVCTTDEIPL